MQPVAYMVSRFPKVTETFVLDEIVGLGALGTPVLVHSLLRTSEDVAHPTAQDVLRRTTFGSRRPDTLLRAQLHWARRRPRQLAGLWLRVLRQNTSSPAEWLKSVVTLLVAAQWARELQGRGISRIHAHWATHPALAAYVGSHLLDVPYGFTAHAHDLYGENGMLREKLRAADLVVTISEYNRRLLTERFGALADRVVLLHCGVDRDVFTPTPPPPPGPVGRLLCVGSLSDYKGHSYLLAALALLRDRGLELRCTLVGDGPLREALQRQVADLGLGGSVELLGRRAAPEVRSLLQECDVFVLPSVPVAGGRMEGIPVALMEAMAVGRPVVATALSGIPELVTSGETGLLVPPADVMALAAAIERLLRDPGLRQRLAVNGPRRVARDFDQQVNVAILASLLARAAGSGAPATAALSHVPPERA